MKHIGASIAWAATVIGCSYMALAHEGAAAVVGVLGFIASMIILSSGRRD